MVIGEEGEIQLLRMDKFEVIWWEQTESNFQVLDEVPMGWKPGKPKLVVVRAEPGDWVIEEDASMDWNCSSIHWSVGEDTLLMDVDVAKVVGERENDWKCGCDGYWEDERPFDCASLGYAFFQCPFWWQKLHSSIATRGFGFPVTWIRWVDGADNSEGWLGVANTDRDEDVRCATLNLVSSAINSRIASSTEGSGDRCRIAPRKGSN